MELELNPVARGTEVRAQETRRKFSFWSREGRTLAPQASTHTDSRGFTYAVGAQSCGTGDRGRSTRDTPQVCMLAPEGEDAGAASFHTHRLTRIHVCSCSSILWHGGQK
jgi:hypothetical protein